MQCWRNTTIIEPNIRWLSDTIMFPVVWPLATHDVCMSCLFRFTSACNTSWTHCKTAVARHEHLTHLHKTINWTLCRATSYHLSSFGRSVICNDTAKFYFCFETRYLIVSSLKQSTNNSIEILPTLSKNAMAAVQLHKNSKCTEYVLLYMYIKL